MFFCVYWALFGLCWGYIGVLRGFFIQQDRLRDARALCSRARNQDLPLDMLASASDYLQKEQAIQEAVDVMFDSSLRSDWELGVNNISTQWAEDLGFISVTLPGL